ncbi:MAG: SDR family NAD(P)-dependent oxidoreductase [Rhodobacteraceae bacterium]|nr:SDR family NAD(P)-dependent oxidoreductase [Paracoccaceae bacterium]
MITPSPKKNPDRRSPAPTSPPAGRSRAALGLMAAAAEGRFALQRCAACHCLQYPARDACSHCLSVELAWVEVAAEGVVLAETVVRVSNLPYFRERPPARVGSVQLDAGPVIVALLHAAVPRLGRVRLLNRLDRSGQAILFAVPEQGVVDMDADPQLRELSATPRHRRVLITDARSPNALALAGEMLKAGAAQVFLGLSEPWRPNPNAAVLADLANVTVLPLDLTDTNSVRDLAAQIGGKTDILINNARFLRPGGALDRGDTGFARDEIEVNYLGLLRLAQAFGPAMCARTDDGVNSAVAWVNLLSVQAYASTTDFGCFSASQAAALALSESMRGEFRAFGMRVINVFTGPTDDDWHRETPQPKVSAQALAKSVVQGLNDGLEDVFCGEVARDLIARHRDNAKVLEREMTNARGQS